MKNGVSHRVSVKAGIRRMHLADSGRLMELMDYLSTRTAEVDAALDRYLPKAKERPATLHAAMRYSVFAGGKRLRPVLCLAAAEACGGEISAALAPACAVELMHTYSLVHDDLRRGRPTCHKVFGEGIAILCGDALLTESFIVLAQTPATKRYSTRDHLCELANTGGSRQLIGGQVMDLQGEGKKLTKRDLVRIHEAKTAALLTSALRLGAMTANATPAKLAALTEFGQALGLAYQVIDDILDCTQSTAVLGKTAGKDASVEKSTYPAIIGLDASRREAGRLTQRALEALNPLGKRGGRLQGIATMLLQRDY
jgi:geranylgeranyl diphosphate synthase, type II